MGLRFRWGMVAALALCCLAGLAVAPLTAQGADNVWVTAPDAFRLPAVAEAPPTSMEAQLLGGKPTSIQPLQGLALKGSALGLPAKLEMRITVHYNEDPVQVQDPKHNFNSLLVSSTLGYRMLPDLQVGLNGYYFRSRDEAGFGFSRPAGDRLLGVGPEIKYDLGRWNFMLKSQLESGTRDGRDRGDGLGNWFRVWYAF